MNLEAARDEFAALLDNIAAQVADGEEPNHPTVDLLGKAALKGALDPTTTRNVREHVARCPRCQHGTNEVLGLLQIIEMDRIVLSGAFGVHFHMVDIYRRQKMWVN
jgi:hypothetical protein